MLLTLLCMHIYWSMSTVDTIYSYCQSYYHMSDYRHHNYNTVKPLIKDTPKKDKSSLFKGQSKNFLLYYIIHFCPLVSLEDKRLGPDRRLYSICSFLCCFNFTIAVPCWPIITLLGDHKCDLRILLRLGDTNYPALHNLM